MYSRGFIPGGARPARIISESSGDDFSRSGHTTDDYTSGALSSDDDFVARQSKIPQVLPTNHPFTSVPTRPEGIVPSPGFTASYYRPVARLCRPPLTESLRASKPKCKRRRMVGSTGKVMKEAYFKGIKWAKTFVTGPLDPEHNRLKFHCQICKTNWSIFSKGAREMIRHYQSESHLRKDQRWRFEHLRSVDKVTWQVRHEVRGKDRT